MSWFSSNSKRNKISMEHFHITAAFLHELFTFHKQVNVLEPMHASCTYKYVSTAGQYEGTCTIEKATANITYFACLESSEDAFKSNPKLTPSFGSHTQEMSLLRSQSVWKISSSLPAKCPLRNYISHQYSHTYSNPLSYQQNIFAGKYNTTNGSVYIAQQLQIDQALSIAGMQHENGR